MKTVVGLLCGLLLLGSGFLAQSLLSWPAGVAKKEKGPRWVFLLTAVFTMLSAAILLFWLFFGGMKATDFEQRVPMSRGEAAVLLVGMNLYLAWVLAFLIRECIRK